MATRQVLIDSYAKRLKGIIGQPSSALDSLIVPNKEPLIVSDTFEKIKAPAIPDSETWYPGSVTVGGFIYSDVTVTYDFGSHGRYRFNAGFWGGFGGGAGGGGGPWVDGALPRDGEITNFEIAFGSFTGGAVELFWWRTGGPIQGGFVAVIGGLGVGGSGGTGKWTKL